MNFERLGLSLDWWKNHFTGLLPGLYVLELISREQLNWPWGRRVGTTSHGATQLEEPISEVREVKVREEKSRSAKQASIGHGFTCLPHLTQFSPIHLLQPPQPQCQLPDSHWGSSSNCQEIAIQTVTPWSEMKELWKVTDSTWTISHLN